MQNENMNKIAHIYCRVSTKKQGEGESLDTQEEICTRCANELGYKNTRVWREKFTGSTGDRPVLMDLLEYIKKNPDKSGAVVIRDIDRITRAGSFDYENIKRELEFNGVTLIDSYHLISPKQNALDHLGFDEYEWSWNSSSETAEKMKADYAKEERRNILIRTIGSSIILAGKGYVVRQALDGFRNKKIFIDDKKRTILEPNPERADFFVKMFEMRASRHHTDNEIVTKINAIGYRTVYRKRWDEHHEKIIGRIGGNELTVKHLHKIISEPKYCGIVIEKWTHSKPVKAPYDGLVSIETFNKANEGKIYIEKNNDNTYQVYYNHNQQKTISKKTRNNPLFPYKNIVLCPLCHKPFMGSSPRGKSGKYFPIYHCKRNHKYYGVNKKEFDSVVESLIKNIEFQQWFKESIDKTLIVEYRKKQKENMKDSKYVNLNIIRLEKQKETALDALIASDNQNIKAEIEARIGKLDIEIKSTRKERSEAELTEDDLTAFISEVKYFMEHQDELLLDSTNMQRQQALFGLVFEEFPSYEDLVNGTPKLTPIFAIKKPTHNEKVNVAGPKGLEPSTSCVTGRRSNQLNYDPAINC